MKAGRTGVALPLEETEASLAALAHISDLTGAKVRIFLSEVAEGVSNYRSMHSLTQQVEHQYHGRFLIELLQNAHDSFTEGVPGTSGNRVEIVFDPTDSPHGSLFVANDGEPFSVSNFERLSRSWARTRRPPHDVMTCADGSTRLPLRRGCYVSTSSPRSSREAKPWSIALRNAAN